MSRLDLLPHTLWHIKTEKFLSAGGIFGHWNEKSSSCYGRSIPYMILYGTDDTRSFCLAVCVMLMCSEFE